MTHQNNAAQAANENPRSDEYVNAIIQRHGYDSHETVIARLAQWIGLNGGEDGVTLLMYEAHKALSMLRGTVSDIREAFELSYAMDADDPASATELSHFTNGWRACIMSQVGKPVLMKLAVDATAAIDLINAEAARLRAPVADERAAFETAMQNRGQNVDRWPNPHGGYRRLSTEIAWYAWNDRAALASAPVAGEAFMYGIMGPDGKAHVEEFCESGDRTELQTEVVDHLNRDNPEDGTYSVVALFRDAAPQASAEAFDFAGHLARQAEFSALTFGPGARVAGVCDHIRKELIEVETSGGDLKEWVDVIILGLDGAWRSGATPQEIIAAIVAKQAKNEARTWPDWRTVDPNKAIEHDRGGQP